MAESAAVQLSGADNAQGFCASGVHLVTEQNHLRQTLLDCQADEVAHRDDAAAASKGFSQSGWVLRAWCAMVGAGSNAAVTLIRHI